MDRKSIANFRRNVGWKVGHICEIFLIKYVNYHSRMIFSRMSPKIGDHVLKKD